VSNDAAQAGYVHVVDGIITGVASFRLCEPCLRRAKTNPNRAVEAMRRAYRTTEMH
jgi:hypothetical protein